MKATHRLRSLSRRLFAGVCLIALATSPLLWTFPEVAHADDKLCFPSFITPTIDGVTAGDQGYSFAPSYVFNNGSPDPHARVRFAKTSSHLYIAFEVNNDPTYEQEDVICLVIGADNDPTNDRRILIYPVATNSGNAGTAPGGPPNLVEYWKNSNTWNSSSKEVNNPVWLKDTTGPSPDPNGQNNIRITSTGAAMKSYVVEVRIPINANPAQGINIPTNGDFKLYFNVIRVETVNMSIQPNSALGEMAWPTSAPLIEDDEIAAFDVVDHTPARATWGTASTNSAGCNGVSVSEIKSDNGDPTLIALNRTDNKLTAFLVNSGSASASGVRATFRSTKFGIAADGAANKIPSNPNPTNASGNIAANGGTAQVSTTWDVVNDPLRPTYVANPGICVWVFIEATGAGTQIANPFQYLNMHFGNASRFEHTATINAKGFEAPPNGAANQQFDLYFSTRDEVTSRDPAPTPRGSPPPTTGRGNQKTSATSVRSLLTRIHHVYRRTGKFIKIRGKKFRVVQPVNSFGYWIEHVGTVKATWTGSLSGNGFSKVNDIVSTVMVPKDGEVVLTTKVEAKEPRKCFQGGFITAPVGISLGMLMMGFVLYGWKRGGRRKRDA